MKRIKKGKRLLAVALSMLLAFGGLPTAALAEGQPVQATQRLCEHHPEHTAECGYGEAQPCEHEHTEECYTDELICGYDEEKETTASDSDAEHTHTQECYALDCPHERGEHDADCGYAEAQPCGYTCELCGKMDNEPEPKPGEETEQAVCALTEGCTLPTGHEGECVTEPGEGEKETACTLTEGCTLPDGHEGECVTELPPANDALAKIITSWTFVATDYSDYTGNEFAMPGASMERQADFDTVVSMLPTGISAEIEGETEAVQVDITGWSCPEYVQDENGNWPVAGEYVFTAALPDGYACDPLPTVKALMGGAELYAGETGDFTVTGGLLNTDYSYANNTLTILTSTALTISGTTTTDKIVVTAGVTANLTLAGVNIDVSSASNACAFGLQGTGTANITLSGNNSLASGGLRGGLEVPENAKVVLDGSGSLDSSGATGIGGNSGGGDASGGNSGTIEIEDGIVTATSTGGGAGIGGGSTTDHTWDYTGGNSGPIKISGGKVTAYGGTGAGIGGGGAGGNGGGKSGSIEISDGTVIAAGGGNSAGIGGGGSETGSGGAGGTIKISGGTVVATGSGNGAGIGGGGSNDDEGTYGGKGGAVTISGQGTRVTANGNSKGADVGGGHGRDSGYLGGGGSLSVTGEATLEMQKNGTNAQTTYQNCTIIDNNGNSVEYGDSGRPMASPTLSLSVAPAGSLALPGNITLTATLSDTSGSNAGKSIIFTVGSATYPTETNDSGEATHTITSPSPGTYTFGASFAGDGDNKSASAAEISGYTVSRGAQNALSLIGLDNAYTYGDEPFGLSTSGGSSGGAVSYQSSDTSVASVTGDQVTLLKAGTFTITATRAGDANYDEVNVTSGTVTVNPATPSISLTATGGANINDPIVLTATVSKIGTGATPTGTVTFKEGNTLLAENVALDGSGKATCTVSNLTAGNHTYTVEYSGQVGYYNNTSTSRTVGVGLADQTGFAITDPGAKTYGDSAFTLTAAGGQSSGGVSYSAPDGNGVLTVAADGKATITGAGKVTVTATKAGDNAYNQVTATLDITVAHRDIANVTVDVTGSRVYTGSQLQPDFEVSDSGIAINTGDYINEYGSNVDAGTGAGSIKLIGQRNYTGTKTVAFDIEKRPLDGATITLEAASYTHTGGEIKPAVTKVVVDGVIVPASAFDVGYANNTAVGTATVTVTAKADGNFSGTASTTFEITKSNSSSGGGGGSSGSSNGGSSSSNDSTVTAPKDSYTSTGKQIGQSVSRSDLQRLANAGKSLTIQSGTVTMTFDPAALKAILAAVPATAGNITFAAVPADISAFPDAAALIGTRPAYSFTISYKDSKGNPVVVPVNFPAGSASISLNYTPAEGEVAGSLFMVYVDGKGAVTWLDKSSYTSGKVLADVPHFSVYGVAYKAPVPVFTDIANHWAKADMEFVAARGLLSGTGNNLFSPDAAMTRGMFVTALGRLAGVNPDSYQTRSFTDVKADAYYAAYVEWAMQKNIVKGTGEGLFSPDAPVTREQMAVMMTNYAGQMGYSIPTPLAAVTFADNESISTWAAKEVAAMQRAGIIKGKDGNRFDPQGNATRAEVSAVLRRFVEIVIDPVTAQGWGKNDSGQWLYYKDGKALTGWKQIGSKWYYFDKNGIMAVNTKIDGYEIGPDGARKENH